MTRLVNPFYQFFDDAGNPLSFGSVTFLQSGSNTVLLDTFSDASFNNANANPQILDGEGRLGSTFLDGVYNIILKDRNGTIIQQFDPVGGDVGSRAAFSDWVNSIIYNKNDIVEADDGRFYISVVDNNLGNDPTAQPSLFWARIQFIEDWNSEKEYFQDDIVIASDFLFYVSLVDNNTGNDPTIQPSAFWTVLVNAAALGYDNSNSGLPSNTVQGAIDDIMEIRQSVLDRPLLYLPLTRDFLGIGEGNVNYLRVLESFYLDRYNNFLLAAIDEPRFESAGLLVEGDATNICLQSETFDQAPWSLASGASITIDTTAAPDGNNTADTLTTTALLDTSRVEQTISLADTGQTISFSIFVKQSTTPSARMRVRTVGGTIIDFLLDFDFGTESFTTDQFDASEFVILDNGWYRITGTMILNNTGNTDIVVGMVSNGTAGDLFIWGAQLEEYAFSTSYIVTVAASVMRPRDDVKPDGLDNIPQVTGPWTVFLRFDSTLVSSSGDITLFVFGDSLADQRILVKSDGSVFIRDSVGQFELLPAATISQKTAETLGVVHDGSGNVTAYVDNVNGSPVAVTLADVTGSAQLGDTVAGGENVNGHLSDVRVHQAVLLQQEIRHLTGGE